MFANKKKTWTGNLAKSVVFLTFAVVILLMLCRLFRPLWLDWNNYNTVAGFYEEPENTIETLFLGPSTTVTGVIPMQLYHDYGICSYNFGTERQRISASYFVLREVYQRHPETLKNVILDVNFLFQKPDYSVFYQKAFEWMPLSRNKYQAIDSYSDDSVDTLFDLIPAFSYHERWSSLKKLDFEKASRKPVLEKRGFDNASTAYLDSVDEEQYDTTVLPAADWDQQTEAARMDGDALQWFEKLYAFCGKNGIKLTLMVRPYREWKAEHHNALVELASQYQLDFIDFNSRDIMLEMNYDYLTDTFDGKHPNYYGAEKITAVLGKYLRENCVCTDVRGQDRFRFLESEEKEYERSIAKYYELKNICDLTGYLDTALNIKDSAVFITVRDDGAGALDQAHRDAFKEMGLLKLSGLEYRDCYLAVVENGMVLHEIIKRDRDKDLMDEASSGPLECSGILSEGTVYRMKSGGFYYGNTSSCKLDGKEYAQNSRGMNIVVYDEINHTVIDSAVFDTHAATRRESANAQTALKYNEENGVPVGEYSDRLQKYMRLSRARVNAEKKQLAGQIDEEGLLDFIDLFRENGYVLFFSVRDDAAGALDGTAREALRDREMQEFAQISFQDSYLGVMKNGRMIYEQIDHGKAPLYAENITYTMISGGCESGNVSSIMLNEQEYSPSCRGINIVAYDSVLHKVVFAAAFDTCAIPVRVS